ncbi:MAG: hypothetical protein PVF45_12365, partial [Anaerolineae bacterium]
RAGQRCGSCRYHEPMCAGCADSVYRPVYRHYCQHPCFESEHGGDGRLIGDEDVTPNWCPLGLDDDGTEIETVALVACSARKLTRPALARALYTSVLFRAARTWVEANGWPWHVLSARHGLVDPDQVLAPYDACFQQSAPSGWVEAVWTSLLERYAGRRVHFKLLASLAYRDRLMQRIRDHPDWRAEAPLAGLGIGQQIVWLRERSVKTRRYPGAPPSCPGCGDVSQATKTYGNDSGLAVCLNCKSAFEPMLIGEWVLGGVSLYAIETEGGEWVTVRAVDEDHAEKLALAMGLTPICVQEAEDEDARGQP